MSIIHEALKKASQDEARTPPVEKARRFRFSASSTFPLKRILIRGFLFLTLIAIGYFAFLEWGTLSGRKVISFGGSGQAEMPVAPAPTQATPFGASPPAAAPDSQKSPPSPSVHERRGGEYYVQGSYKEAEREFAAAADLDPKSAVVQNNLGLVLVALGREAEAEARYRIALEVEPGHLQAMNNLAVLYGKQNRLEEARFLFKKVISIRPDYPDAHLNYAVLLERAGYPEEAKRHYQSFLAVAKGDQERAITLVRRHIDRLN